MMTVSSNATKIERISGSDNTHMTNDQSLSQNQTNIVRLENDDKMSDVSGFSNILPASMKMEQQLQ